MASEVTIARESSVNPMNAVRGGGGEITPLKTQKALSEDLGVKLPSKTKRNEDGSFSFEFESSSSYRSPQQKFEREFFEKQGARTNETFRHVESSSENLGWNFASDNSIGDRWVEAWEFRTKSGRLYRMTKVISSNSRGSKARYTFKEK